MKKLQKILDLNAIFGVFQAIMAKLFIFLFCLCKSVDLTSIPNNIYDTCLFGIRIGKRITIDYIVAEKIDEIISAENPPHCVGGIREFIRTCLIVSRFVAPYEIHSFSVNIA
jgi:hypothetical protein